jgi:BirA family biotin operon repressor/biotin-[acetyl-CoA-carboxylase] ligase
VLTGPPGRLAGFATFDSSGLGMDTDYDIVHLDEVASTQDEAASVLRRTGAPTLVVADRQSDGRGRSGRSWVPPDEAMFASFATMPEWESRDLPIIPLLAALAIRDSLEVHTGIRVDVKWPNDLLVGGAKVGGILVEGSEGGVTIGCGINLVWADPPPFAAAVLAASPRPGLSLDVARTWVDALIAMLRKGAATWPIDAYRGACVTIGERVRWDGGDGTATDVAADGALVVVDSVGHHRVVSGDVHLLGGG